MREEHFKALSYLLSTCRGLLNDMNSDTPRIIQRLLETTASLADLRLEGEWTDSFEYDDEGSYNEIVNHQIKASEDDIQRVFRELQEKDASYARLKKLYDVRLEVTRDALAKNRVEMATLRSRLEETENHLRWSSSHGPDPDVF